MRKLAIAWRNPVPPQHIRRWQTLAKDSRRSVYAVQQLVKSGMHHEWSNTMCLELVHSVKRGPVEKQRSPVVRWLLTSIP